MLCNVSFTILLVFLITLTRTFAQKDAHFWPNRNTIVHLFEWKWTDIAEECERFLQHKGFGGVQISPPNENLVIENRPWWERYQPVSYMLITRSGNEEEFADMTRRCNKVGIRIYADTVINHMTAGNGRGTGGSVVNETAGSFPAVPYDHTDFHKKCIVNNYQSASNVRNCRLVNLIDLNQSLPYIRNEIAAYMNHLIDLGVAGFRIDAAKHMWPNDLKEIYSKLKNLNTNYGFAENWRPFIYQEVIDLGNEAVHSSDYTGIGTVVEFKYSNSLGNVFHGNDKLTYLSNWGTGWGLINGLDALAFIDNHDNQRSANGVILTYKEPKQYKMAIAFMLAHPYGTTRLMSSFAFDDKDQGPPAANGHIISPGINSDDTCSNGWVCEHRWRQIFNMVGFRNATQGTEIQSWWSNGDQQIAFCRGNKGFIVFTNWADIDRTFETCLSPGTYCDVISGGLVDKQCTGRTITVENGGAARIALSGFDADGVLAIHANAKQS